VTPAIRLQRVLADAGVASRRGAEALISAGRVRVDGEVAELGQRVDPAGQRVELDGRPVGPPQRHRYLALSKPAGVTSTVSDRHARRTVLDLVPSELRGGARLYPVGRLDRESEGLVLLTNDGDLTDKLLHPRHGVEREYAIGLADALGDEAEAALRRGVELADGRATLRSLRLAGAAEAARIAGLVFPPPRAGLVWYLVGIAEGRKRQIRRMFAAVGAPVERLVRMRIGTVMLDGIAPGTVRHLEPEEVARLRAVAGPAGEDGARSREPTAADGPAAGPQDGTPSVPSDDGTPEGGPRPGPSDPSRRHVGRPAFQTAEESLLDATEPAGAAVATSPERPLERRAHHPTEPAGAAPAAEAGPRDGTRRLAVAIDGPGSSGKSTVGAAAAGYLGYRFCDTGMFYRAVTWLALERGVPTDDGAALAALVPDVELAADAEGRLSRVLIGERDVTELVATPRVDRHVSDVARQAEVRAALLPRQRDLAVGGGMIMAGRDIGTVVLPDADLKLFLDASAEERARRRAEQRGLVPDSAAAKRILAELRRRDRIDASRSVAPLRAAPDAVVIRTDGNTVGQTIDAVVAAIRRRERELERGR
jgi:cytidylate kinase